MNNKEKHGLNAFYAFMHFRFLLLSTMVCITVLFLSACSVEKKYTHMDWEQQKKLDVQLFNELMVRKDEWPGTKYTRKRRINIFEVMDKEGFEVAGLALKLWDIRPGTSGGMRFNRRAYDRLIELAELGDHSAECLASMTIWKWKIKSDYDKRYRYIKSAADAGQAKCTGYLGGIYRKGLYGIGKDLAQAEKLREKAAYLGSESAVLLQIFKYKDYMHNMSLTDKYRARCWYLKALENDTGMAWGDRPTVQRMIGVRNDHKMPVVLEEFKNSGICEKYLSKKN